MKHLLVCAFVLTTLSIEGISACVNEYLDNYCEAYGKPLCATRKDVRKVCKKTCNACNENFDDVTAAPNPQPNGCRDTFCELAKSQCSDPNVAAVCQQTCGQCGSVILPTTAAEIIERECKDDYPSYCASQGKKHCDKDNYVQSCWKTCTDCYSAEEEP